MLGEAGSFRQDLDESSLRPGRWSVDLRDILTEVDSWPAEERLRLVQEVWDRLVGQGYEPRISDELKAELDRRLAAHRADPGAAIPWERVEAEASVRFRR
jgi:putative addiction module component (TIGR02574 family)